MTRHTFFSRTLKPLSAALLLAALGYALWQLGRIEWTRWFQ